jgi:hypothetical protein
MQTWIYDYESMEFPCTLVDAMILAGFYVAVDREDIIALVNSICRNKGEITRENSKVLKTLSLRDSIWYK